MLMMFGLQALKLLKAAAEELPDGDSTPSTKGKISPCLRNSVKQGKDHIDHVTSQCRSTRFLEPISRKGKLAAVSMGFLLT